MASSAVISLSCITIRSPTGKEKDFSVDCEEGWTVNDVKVHLSEEYPSKPAVASQRIIYQGKLLLDDLLIRDVLQPCLDSGSADEKTRVFFMISKPPASAPSSPAPAVTASLDRGISCPVPTSTQDPLSAAAGARSPSTPLPAAMPATPSVSTSNQETELRRRRPMAAASTPVSTPPTPFSTPMAAASTPVATPPLAAASSSDFASLSPHATPALAQQALFAPGAAAPAYPPGYSYWSNPAWTSSAYSGLTSEQQAYMSAYYQQCGTYMSQPMWQAYIASASAAAAAHAAMAYRGTANPYVTGMPQHGAFVPPAPMTAPVQPGVAAAAVPGPAVGQAHRPPAPAPEQQPPMAAAPGANAGGLLGAVDEDEDDEVNQQPRALRHIAAAVRMVIMLSVLYSICTPFRFALLLVATLVINLYQAGVFNLRRGPQRRQPMDMDAVRQAIDAVRRNADEQLRRQRGDNQAAAGQGGGGDNDNAAADQGGDGDNAPSNAVADGLKRAASGNGSDGSSDEEGSVSDSSTSGSASDVPPPQPQPSTTRVIAAAARAFVMSLFLDPEVAAN